MIWLFPCLARNLCKVFQAEIYRVIFCKTENAKPPIYPKYQDIEGNKKAQACAVVGSPLNETVLQVVISLVIVTKIDDCAFKRRIQTDGLQLTLVEYQKRFCPLGRETRVTV